MNTRCNGVARFDCVEKSFPPAAIFVTELLRPLDSWHAIYLETRITGVEFDAFWYEAAVDGICYFFSWLGKPRGTVLVIFDRGRATHVECRKAVDVPMTEAEIAPILAELAGVFAGLPTAPPGALS